MQFVNAGLMSTLLQRMRTTIGTVVSALCQQCQICSAADMLEAKTPSGFLSLLATGFPFSQAA